MISIIAAIGKNRELGKNNALLWHIPGELPRFKHITMGHPIIMGRKTFESIGRVLPNRTNIVITRDFSTRPRLAEMQGVETVKFVGSLDEAIEEAKKATGSEEIFVIGGGQIFEQALPLADKLYLTLVAASFDADTFFPDYSMFSKVVEREEHESEFKYTFLTLQR
ncbi:MAG: dihydrofolate reductase [Candidatus Levybacteria bacterium]|nr:dihydrofolate reductase [Candidatus Levybacteria bacterium]